MNNPEKISAQAVASEFHNAHSSDDLKKAFTDSIDLKKNSTQPQWKESLAEINAGINMKRLGLEGFTISDVDIDKSGKKLVSVLNNDGTEQRLLSTDGLEHGFSARDNTSADLKTNILKDTSARQATLRLNKAENSIDQTPLTIAGKTFTFGDRNRQMTVSLDESKAVYSTHKGDNLWSIAEDYLQQQGKTGNKTEVANLVKRIASENKIQDANHIGINQQIYIKSLEAVKPLTRPVAQTEVAPLISAAQSANAAQIAAAAPAMSVEAARAAQQTESVKDSGTKHHQEVYETIKQDASLVAQYGTKIANEFVSPYVSGMGAKLFMQNYGNKMIETALEKGTVPVKAVALIGLGLASAVGVSEGLNATSVAMGNKSLDQARTISNGLGGYAGMRAFSAIEGRFANAGNLAKKAASILGGAAEWSIYDFGKTNPFLINDKTNSNYTPAETVESVKDDFVENALFGGGAHLLGSGAKLTGKRIYATGKGTWDLTKNAFTRPAATEAEIAYRSLITAH